MDGKAINGPKRALGRKHNVFNTFTRDWQLWIMVLPACIIIFTFQYLPMYGIQLAFRDYDFTKGFVGGNWAGLKYFERYFTSPMFWPTLKNTFTIAISMIVFGFPMPIILAIILNQIRSVRFKNVLRTTVYLPYFISTVVMVSLIRIMCTPSSGIISMFLKYIGLLSPDVNLVGDPPYFVFVYVISGIWQSCGWNSIIYFAALSSVDAELYDAAKIDGAGRFRIIWHIDLPTIRPTIIILLILSMGSILSVGFEKVFLMQNNLNKSVSEVISTYVYNIGIMSSQFSFGAAVGLFNTLVNFTCVVTMNIISKKTSEISIV